MENVDEEQSTKTNNDENIIASLPNQIQYLVLSGGGLKGVFTTYGLLRKKHFESLWNIQKIKRIYSTSSGSLVGFLMIMVKFLDWKLIDDYMVLRPWQRLVSRDKFLGFADVIQKGGFMIKKTMLDAISPLLCAADLDPNLTLSELYNWSKIEFHAFCVEMNNFHSVDMSYKTHPDLKVVDAIWRSCSVPFIFVPDREKQNIFCDGSLLMHYALTTCIEQTNCSTDSILGVKIIPVPDSKITDIVSLLSTLIQRVFIVLNNRFETVALEHEFLIKCNHVSFEENYGLIFSEELRRQLIYTQTKKQ
jgi:predicted acylesterase/phospholipase RssA